MFKKGQQIIHCRDGLGVVVDETVIAENGYFVVRTTRGGMENIYVPKSRAESIIRPVMNIDEADELVAYIKDLEIEFIPNTKQRRDALKRRLGSGDVHDIANLFKQLYLYKKRNDGSIKFGPVDLDMLEYASKNLLDELSITYAIGRNEIEEEIYKRIS